MFGKNPIVGRKFFDDATEEEHKGELLVTTIFYTLQGEGPFAGRPAIFVRLAHCNLACSFCDTDFDTGTWYSPAALSVAIKGEIDKYFGGCQNAPEWADTRIPCWAKPRCIMLVITGGEPSLQKNVVPFYKYVHDEALFDSIQIESNGIHVLDTDDDYVFLVCSPKCKERNGQPVEYLKPNPAMLNRADALKFVMSADPASPYSFIPDWAFEWLDLGRGSIYISPMNVYTRPPKKAPPGASLEERNAAEAVSFWEPGLLDMVQNEMNHRYAWQYCQRHGCVFSGQLHLLGAAP